MIPRDVVDARLSAMRVLTRLDSLPPAPQLVEPVSYDPRAVQRRLDELRDVIRASEWLADVGRGLRRSTSSGSG
jgi:hypothetical protein